MAARSVFQTKGNVCKDITVPFSKAEKFLILSGPLQLEKKRVQIKYLCFELIVAKIFVTPGQTLLQHQAKPVSLAFSC